jgi:hypothetical protein
VRANKLSEVDSGVDFFVCMLKTKSVIKSVDTENFGVLLLRMILQSLLGTITSYIKCLD